jgi:hypothetical protein
VLTQNFRTKVTFPNLEAQACCILDEESNKEIKAICQPEFFASWLLALQVPAPNRRLPPHHPRRI